MPQSGFLQLNTQTTTSMQFCKNNQHVTHPKKLLNSKWTAVSPVNKEKHFMVTKLIIETNESRQIHIKNIKFVIIEAVHSKRTQTIAWVALNDKTTWRQGWV
jgi:tryptophan-rich hypothetical protein